MLLLHFSSSLRQANALPKMECQSYWEIYYLIFAFVLHFFGANELLCLVRRNKKEQSEDI